MNLQFLIGDWRVRSLPINSGGKHRFERCSHYSSSYHRSSAFERHPRGIARPAATATQIFGHRAMAPRPLVANVFRRRIQTHDNVDKRIDFAFAGRAVQAIQSQGSIRAAACLRGNDVRQSASMCGNHCSSAANQAQNAHSQFNR